MKGSYSAVVAFYLAALAVRTSYELLKKAGRLDPKRHTLFAIILLWRHLEEEHLEASYGEAYRSYRARTWF